MSWPAALSRPQFEQGAKQLVNAPSAAEIEDDSELDAHQLTAGWEWNEHRLLPALGYLSKQLVVYLALEDSPGNELESEVLEDSHTALEIEDEAAAAETAARAEFATAKLSVCYSPSYSVPVLYFNIYKQSGAPLALEDILGSTLFHSSRRSGYPFTTLADSAHDQPSHPAQPASPAPFLSQAEHPTRGAPSWFLHPCETQTIIAEVLATRGERGVQWELEWIESWLMVVGSVVDLRG